MFDSPASSLPVQLATSDAWDTYAGRVVVARRPGLPADRLVCCDGRGMVRFDNLIGSAGMVYWPLSRVCVLVAPDPVQDIPASNVLERQE